MEGDRSAALDQAEQQGGQVGITDVGARVSAQQVPVEPRQKPLESPAAAGEKDGPQRRIGGQLVEGRQAFGILAGKKPAMLRQQIARRTDLESQRLERRDTRCQAIRVDRPRKRCHPYTVAGA